MKVEEQRISSLPPEKIDKLFQHFIKNSKDIPRKMLRAFLVLDEKGDPAEVEKKLEELLPKFMHPNEVIFLDDIPKLPNGKVDKNALNLLEKVKVKKNHKLIEPESSTLVKKLTEIWVQVLGVDPIFPEDNFFEVGGDSILSIQIIAKARTAGIKIPPNAIFEYQTIEELSERITEEQDARPSEVENIFGEVPLSPIQGWFFSAIKSNPAHWNQIAVYDKENLQESFCKRLIEETVKRHDSLRLNFSEKGHQWQAFIRQEAGDVFKILDLSKHHYSLVVLEGALRSYQEKISLKRSPLFQAYYCKFKEKSVLALVAHHLVIDNVSWGILQEDFNSVVENADLKALSSSTSNYGNWAKELPSLNLSRDLAFWREQQSAFSLSKFVDVPVLSEKHCRLQVQKFPPKFSGQLRGDVHEVLSTNVTDFISTALLLAMNKLFEEDNFLIGYEHNGRSIVSGRQDTFDFSSLVGWFTAYYPVAFFLKSGASSIETLMAVKDNLRAVPNNGISYGHLRYTQKQALKQRPELLVNYLGEKKESNLSMLSGGTRSGENERDIVVELNAFFKAGHLECNWTLPKADIFDELVQEFNHQLEILVEDALGVEDQKFSASDFSDSGLSQDDLDTLFDT